MKSFPEWMKEKEAYYAKQLGCSVLSFNMYFLKAIDFEKYFNKMWKQYKLEKKNAGRQG